MAPLSTAPNSTTYSVFVQTDVQPVRLTYLDTPQGVEARIDHPRYKGVTSLRAPTRVHAGIQAYGAIASSFGVERVIFAAEGELSPPDVASLRASLDILAPITQGLASTDDEFKGSTLCQTILAMLPFGLKGKPLPEAVQPAETGPDFTALAVPARELASLLTGGSLWQAARDWALSCLRLAPEKCAAPASVWEKANTLAAKVMTLTAPAPLPAKSRPQARVQTPVKPA